MLKFLKEVKGEFKNVVWVKRDTAINTAALVIILSIFVGIYVSLFDLGVMKLLASLI